MRRLAVVSEIEGVDISPQIPSQCSASVSPETCNVDQNWNSLAYASIVLLRPEKSVKKQDWLRLLIKARFRRLMKVVHERPYSL